MISLGFTDVFAYLYSVENEVKNIEKTVVISQKKLTELIFERDELEKQDEEIEKHIVIYEREKSKKKSLFVLIYQLICQE